MNTEKIVKNAKIMMIVSIGVGILLLILGILFSLTDASFISNNRSLVGLSLIPFSLALVYYIKLSRIKKSPQSMKSIIINESDERLIALKNEADAKSFKIVQATIFLFYMAYTLIVPEDIFESIGWWILLVLLFITFLSQGILSYRVLKNQKTEE